MSSRKERVSLILASVCICSCAGRGQDEPKMPTESVVPIVKEIDRAPVLSLASVRSILGVDLRDTGEDSRVLHVYEGSSDRWKRIELRLLNADGKTGAMLTLEPAEPVPMDALVKEFGKEPRLNPPNPAAGNAATMAYEYQRRNGLLRFVFKDFQHYTAESIIFDRLP